MKSNLRAEQEGEGAEEEVGKPRWSHFCLVAAALHFAIHHDPSLMDFSNFPCVNCVFLPNYRLAATGGLKSTEEKWAEDNQSLLMQYRANQVKSHPV